VVGGVVAVGLIKLLFGNLNARDASTVTVAHGARMSEGPV
jgi:hypothetical protein